MDYKHIYFTKNFAFLNDVLLKGILYSGEYNCLNVIGADCENTDLLNL